MAFVIPTKLQDRFDMFLIALGAQIMRWLRIVLTWLYTVDQRTRNEFVQFVALFIHRPIFKIYYFFFKVTYAAGERRLLVIGRKKQLLSGNNDIG